MVTLELKRSKVERLIQQKSLREKDLERRVEHLAKRLADSEHAAAVAFSGWASNRRNYNEQWRARRAESFGINNKWLRWLAGGGDGGCNNPLTRCYWVRTEPEPEEGDQLSDIFAMNRSASHGFQRYSPDYEMIKFLEKYKSSAPLEQPQPDANVATRADGKKQ